ncbi:hypothetical protein WKW79_24775 [Variovorax robiniae]|uniref:Uncharacterized protein n=1 Tax=Variovorax robiniae TaxID=1836199 RepID=A0ABU8XFJ2_9BURK
MQDTEHFYQKILEFPSDEEGTFYIDKEDCKIKVMFKYARAELKGEKNSLFEYSIAKNFPSYCIKLKELGVEFDFVMMTPGGYVARVFDPSGNPIEITCDDFFDEAGGDISAWSTYKRY